MKKQSKTWFVLAITLLLNVFVYFPVEAEVEKADSRRNASAMKQEVYRRLDSIRTTKKKQLLSYIQSIRSRAMAIGQDQMMLAYFHLKNKYHHLTKDIAPPESLVEHIERVKKKIRQHYLRQYLQFYDILFINRDGDIFSSIRHQKDYGQNIFKEKLASTSIARQLRETPGKQFVDYQYYEISDEPSAFFIVPVYKEKVHTGWFVLQCAINRINRMFTEEEGLGRTGEVFLVNRQQYMLTESRFFRDSSILRQHLSKENIERKFALGKGRREVVDYRGRKALSSFEVCRVENHRWLLITKIDEDEVITDHYRRTKRRLQPGLMDLLLSGSSTPVKKGALREGKRIEVDMDEYRKATPAQLISTYGVSTCTAMLVTYPGRFAYLAHISNIDRLYEGQITNLVRQVFRRIERFEICSNDQRNLEVFLVAPHGETALRAIDFLLEEGVFLSQIRFLCYHDALYANVIHDCLDNETIIEWVLDRESGRSRQQLASTQQTIGEQIKQLIEYR